MPASLHQRHMVGIEIVFMPPGYRIAESCRSAVLLAIVGGAVKVFTTFHDLSSGFHETVVAHCDAPMQHLSSKID